MDTLFDKHSLHQCIGSRPKHSETISKCGTYFDKVIADKCSGNLIKIPAVEQIQSPASRLLITTSYHD
jgi:hypothetical protein